MVLPREDVCERAREVAVAVDAAARRLAGVVYVHQRARHEETRLVRRLILAREGEETSAARQSRPQRHHRRAACVASAAAAAAVQRRRGVEYRVIHAEAGAHDDPVVRRPQRAVAHHLAPPVARHVCRVGEQQHAPRAAMLAHERVPRRARDAQRGERVVRAAQPGVVEEVIVHSAHVVAVA